MHKHEASSSRRGTYPALLSGALGALLLAGCTGAPPSPEPTSPPPYITHVVDPRGGFPTAEIKGTLLLDGACLTVRGIDGIEYPLAVPDVATWDAEATALTIGGLTFAVGEEILWGGAYGPIQNDHAVPAACLAEGEIAFAYHTPASQ